jgi:hypothetical protein
MIGAVPYAKKLNLDIETEHTSMINLPRYVQEESQEQEQWAKAQG